MTTRKRKPQTPKPIEGEALLEKIKSDEVKDLTRADAAIACGYWRFSTDVKGKRYKQARVDRFNKAIVTAATGVDFLSPNYHAKGPRGPQKNLRGMLKVTQANLIILGTAYLRQLDWKKEESLLRNCRQENQQIIVKKILEDPRLDSAFPLYVFDEIQTP